MSLSDALTLACPACGTPVPFVRRSSVNGGAQPALRAAILDGSFQRRACAGCGTACRLEPEFTYIDVARRQYIGVWPAARRGDWRECAAEADQAVAAAFGAGATPEGRALGSLIEPRVVFGWPALAEKLIAAAAGIDDRTLEVAKIAALGSLDQAPLPGRLELRLVGLDGPDPLLAWLGADGVEHGGRLRLPRALLDEIEADAPAWQALRDEVADGSVVDFQREMLGR